MADHDPPGRELIQRPGTPLSIGPLPLRDLDDLARVAKVIAESGMFKDATTPARVAVRLFYALTMGFQPIAGMMGVDVIEGNPTPNAHLWAAAIEDSPLYDWNVVERTDERCTIEFFRADAGGKMRKRGTVTWTLADAERANLAGKANWRRYPRAMLYARAMTEGGRAYCPGLFGGVRAYDPEELGGEDGPPPPLNVPEIEVDADGQIVVEQAYDAGPPLDPTGDPDDEAAAKVAEDDALATRLWAETEGAQPDLRDRIHPDDAA